MNVLYQPISMSVINAAAMVGVSDKTIRRAIAKGDLKHARIGRKILILDADLKAWIESRLVNSIEDRRG